MPKGISIACKVSTLFLRRIATELIVNTLLEIGRATKSVMFQILIIANCYSTQCFMAPDTYSFFSRGLLLLSALFKNFSANIGKINQIIQCKMYM